MPDRTIIVTKLRRIDGVWLARVSDGNGTTLDVDRRYGSWQALIPRVRGSRRRIRRELLPDVAAALQQRVRPIERREQKEQAA